jgi:hypothetical protein
MVSVLALVIPGRRRGVIIRTEWLSLAGYLLPWSWPRCSDLLWSDQGASDPADLVRDVSQS